MVDHFSPLARVYERLIPPPEPERFRDLLGLPVNGWLLDAGGGTGRASAGLRPLVGDLIVSDRSLAMLRKAKEKGGRLIVQAHSERLPFADSSFQRVLVVDALHHFVSPREAIGDLLRVLRTGGRLVIEEPDAHHPWVRLAALAEKVAFMKSHFYTSSDIVAMIAEHGISAVARSDGRFSVWIIADK